jgi:hypothetical protein
MLLVLNSRDIVDRLPEWFPQARSEIVLATTQSSLAVAGIPDPGQLFRHLVVLPDNGSVPSAELAELCARFGVQRILSTGERQVLPAARLRELLGLPGQDVACALAFRDKFVMKKIIGGAGIPVARMRRVNDPAELFEFAGEIGFPLVVKHLDHGGSDGLRVLADRTELVAFAEWWQAEDGCAPRLAEEWIDGDFYQVNGLMDGGEPVFGQPCWNPYSDWFSVRYDAPGMSAMLADDHPLSPRLRDTATRVLAALPTVPGVCAFQTEFFHTPDDRLVLCEAACRAGGSLMVDTHETVFGINLHGASLLGQAGRGIRPDVGGPTGPRLGFARFPPTKGTLLSIPERCPLPNVVHYAVRGEVGRDYAQPHSLGPYIAEVIFTLSERLPGDELRAVEEWWNRNVVWQHRTNALPPARSRAAARTA